MDAIERDNVSLRGVLPKVYARGNLDPTNLINRRTLEFDDADIARIANTYHNWRNQNGTWFPPVRCLTQPGVGSKLWGRQPMGNTSLYNGQNGRLLETAVH